MRTRDNVGSGLAIIVGAAAIGFASHLGLWYAPWFAGLLWGLVAQRTARALIAGWIMSILGYGVALVSFATSAQLVAAARVVATIMGFGPHAALVLVVTEVLGLLFVTAGTWVGLALGSLFSVLARLIAWIRTGPWVVARRS